MKTRSSSVADQLRIMILEGDYRPGTHLQEVPVAQAMGVSRTPVRAAFAILEREGLLCYAPKRGFSVRIFGLEEIADKFIVRSVLEGAAAGLCAQRGLSEEHLSRLEAALEEGSRIISAGRGDPRDREAYRATKDAFHRTVIDGSGSDTTAEIVWQLTRIPLLSDRNVLLRDDKLIARSHDDHHRIRDAIVDRHAGRAEALMREHVAFLGRIAQEYLLSDAAPAHLRFGEVPGRGA